MAQEKEKGEKLVLPGDYIGKVEEYLPGDNVTDDSGNVVALIMGLATEDTKNLSISVKPVKKEVKPKPDDIVYGQVVKSDRGRFNVAIGAFQPRGSNLILPTKMEATLKIEQSREDRRSPVRVADYIRGRLFISRYGTDLNINGSELGVLLAKCHRCRQFLVQTQSGLRCENCQLTETRKVASDYGKIDLYGKEL